MFKANILNRNKSIAFKNIKAFINIKVLYKAKFRIYVKVTNKATKTA